MVGDLDPRYDKRGVGANYGWGFSPAIRQGGVGGGVHFRHNAKGGGRGSCLAEEGEVPYMKGQLHDLLNSERFPIDYNDFRNFNT